MNDSTRLGESLREAGSDEFEGVAGRIVAHWHRSILDVELVAWRTPGGHLLQFQLTVRGEVAQWSEAAGLQTGLVVESESLPGCREENVRFDSKPVPGALARAADILTAAMGLGADERTLFARHLRGP